MLGIYFYYLFLYLYNKYLNNLDTNDKEENSLPLWGSAQIYSEQVMDSIKKV